MSIGMFDNEQPDQCRNDPPSRCALRRGRRNPNAEWNPNAETRMLSSAFFAPQRWKHARWLGWWLAFNYQSTNGVQSRRVKAGQA